jgi:heme oxygenase (staphylobilin-producing)
MFVATNRLTIKAGFGQELEQQFGRRGGVEQQADFLGFELWKLDKEADHEEYLVVTHWESKEAHHNWTRSEAFRQAHSGPRPEFLIGGESSSYEVRFSSLPGRTKART